MSDDLLSEFLAEATAALDAIQAEKTRMTTDVPQDEMQKRLLDLVHTARGASGFLAVPRLEAVAGATAEVLDALHEQNLAPTPGIVMLVLGSLDRMRDLLEGVAERGYEPEGDDSLLLGALSAIPGTFRFVGSGGEEAATAEEDTDDGVDAADPLLGATLVDWEAGSGLDDLAMSGGAFLLFRQDRVLRALDLAHVGWLDLLEESPVRDGNGKCWTVVQGEAIPLVGFDEVRERNPKGPWPLIVIMHRDRQVGVAADEIHEIVNDPRAIGVHDDDSEAAERLHLRIALPEEFLEDSA